MENFKKSCVYQIYPKSFKDTSGNGQGDLKGITKKLDYLKKLGVDYVWLTPIYISPQHDNGYDVADYYNINPDFGTMEDFEELVEEAGKRGIKIMLDMVFNHTSTEHEWFKKAMAGVKKYMDYYILKDPVDGREPTNWESKFGGNAWEYVPHLNKYYLHLFDKTQADLDWENEELREEIYRIVNFWLEKGVKGFRLDVINLISKPEIFENDYVGDGRRFYTDGPKIHEYLKELNRRTFGKYNDVVTVGEMSSTTIENCIRYSNPQEKELSMVFNFHHLKIDYKNGNKWSDVEFDFAMLKDLFDNWQTKMDKGSGWNALFWCNHDQPRVVSRYGDDKSYYKESAKMLATTIHMMKGTPYIYQGEEIGMTNAYFDSISQYRDVESINYYEILKKDGVSEDEILRILQKKSRDNSRTPMQWDNSSNAGFTSGEPWIGVISNYREINAKKSLEDKESVFYHYKELIDIRKKYDVTVFGNYAIIEKDHDKVYAYKRKYKDEEMLVVCNFYGEETEFLLEGIESYSVLNSNYKESMVEDGKVHFRPYEAVIFYKKV
ncbi:alpha,alpha-phosphotrehalase [uncultured Ilyobacter sp.]|uniref:alpha,alpha-phosphotrehalase n=1 Tax=uncultured Ilyobacter sp. TaxID=544433 RepID=UPI0029C66090|nr:alpha,alpha-phosphotrehalase [uncultured Ilyobacter sp.]